MTINPLSNSTPWGQVANSYSDMADWVMDPFANKAIDLSGITKNSSIADIACGTGLLSTLVSPHVKDIASIDFSQEMLDILNKKIQLNNFSNISVSHGDGQALVFESQRFSHVFSLFGLMFFPERNKGFSELYRILKNDGVAIVSSWAEIEKSTLMQLTSECIKSAIPNAPSPRANSNTLENPYVFKQEMEAAGFKSVVIHEYKVELNLISAKLFWQLMSEGGAPIVLLKEKYPTDEWNKINQRILEFLDSKYQDHPIQLSTTAYIGVGLKNFSVLI